MPHGQVGVLTLFSRGGGIGAPSPLAKVVLKLWRGFGLQKGLYGVYCQPSNGLKFNRQRSKKVIFAVSRKKGRFIQ